MSLVVSRQTSQTTIQIMLTTKSVLINHSLIVVNDGCRNSMIGLMYVRWTYTRVLPADAGIPVTWWVIKLQERLDLQTYIGRERDLRILYAVHNPIRLSINK